MTVEEFQEEISTSIISFGKNMEHLKVKPKTGPEWWSMFSAWMDIGTEQEQDYWGERGE